MRVFHRAFGTSALAAWSGAGVAFCIVGCQSSFLPHQEYDSPRVTGRVIDARTREGIAGAVISRGAYVAPVPGTEARDRGTLREGPPPVTTDRQGRFELDSRRGFYVLDRSSGYSSTISISHPGYQPFETNFTRVRFAHENVKSEPLVEAGDLPLEPVTDSGK